MRGILGLAWRNVGRNRRRTLLTTTAIALSTIFLIFAQSYFGGMQESFYKNLIRYEIGHVKISAKEFLRLQRILPKEHLIYNNKTLEANIKNLIECRSVTSRIKFHLILSHKDKNEPCRGIGIDTEIERQFLNMEDHIIKGRYLGPSAGEIILGEELAKNLGVGPGGEVLAVTTDINYSTYALTFRVAGIFRTGFSIIDKKYFYIPINKAQELLDCSGAAHEILILIDDFSRANTAAARIENFLKKEGLDSELTAVSWQDHFMVKTYLPFAQNFIFILLFIIMIISALVISNTMLMAVMERTHEIGIIKSMGMRDKRIIWMILSESFFIGILGVGIGGFLGTAISMIFQKIGLDLSPILDKMDLPLPVMSPVLYPKFTLTILFFSTVFALITAFFAAVYPALKASRLAPVEALKSDLK